MMQNALTLEILPNNFEKWNQKLAATVSKVMFASMDKLCPKDIMEEIADEEQISFEKT